MWKQSQILLRSPKVDGSVQKPRGTPVHPFPDPVGHFVTPWWPFWIFEVLTEGMIESKNLFSESYSGGPMSNIGQTCTKSYHVIQFLYIFINIYVTYSFSDFNKIFFSETFWIINQ